MPTEKDKFLLASFSEGIKRGMKWLEPLITERHEQETQYGGDWPGKPTRGPLHHRHSKMLTLLLE